MMFLLLAERALRDVKGSGANSTAKIMPSVAISERWLTVVPDAAPR